MSRNRQGALAPPEIGEETSKTLHEEQVVKLKPSFFGLGKLLPLRGQVPLQAPPAQLCVAMGRQPRASHEWTWLCSDKTLFMPPHPLEWLLSKTSKQTNNNKKALKCWQRCRNWKPCIAGRYCKMAQLLWKTSLAVAQKGKNRIACDPAIPFRCRPQRIECRDLKRYLFNHVYSSTIPGGCKGSHPRVHSWTMDECNHPINTMSLSMQVNTVQPLIGRVFRHVLQHGWTFRHDAEGSKPDVK